MTVILDSLLLPKGLKSLSIQQLDKVALELRADLIRKLQDNSAHFASSLGVVELTLALHYVFDTPNDKIVWDTGHQAYIHKLLTGRRRQFSSVRNKDGLSGFLKRSESKFDAFGAGHAGTSVSAALGMATAISLDEEKNITIAVIGDGAFTSGMVFEALNHAGGIAAKNLIVILNDNACSISKNVGALSSQDNKLQIAALTKAFDCNYFGPIDGYNSAKLVDTLESTKTSIKSGANKCPILIHLKTIKGRGHSQAEKNPIAWHAVTRGMLRPQDKQDRQETKQKVYSYSDVFGLTLSELAKRNSKILAITAAMDIGTGLKSFKEELPKQFFDVGICEQHAVTFAAGLACQGYRPVVAIYSTFPQRCFDQILHDVCIQNLPVVFAIDRAGVVGNDGETHQGVFDIAFLRAIPNLVLMSPKDGNELRDMLVAAFNFNCPVAIRYPKAEALSFNELVSVSTICNGKAETYRQGQDGTIISYGPLYQRAVELRLRAMQELGLDLGIVNGRFAKPLDTECILNTAAHSSLLITLEDHALIGGFGAAIAEELSRHPEIKVQLLSFGLKDSFLPHTTQEQQHQMHQLDVDSILFKLSELKGQAKLVRTV